MLSQDESNQTQMHAQLMFTVVATTALTSHPLDMIVRGLYHKADSTYPGFL